MAQLGRGEDGRSPPAAFALAQIGLPYVWGGDGPAAGHAGFECSGLTTAAFAAAGVRLPRTAHTQYLAGPTVAPGAALQPGDLLFHGVPSCVHHVGLHLDDGVMVNAPTFGKPVQLAYYRWRGDDYLGAGRPSVGPALSPIPLQAYERLPARPPGTGTDSRPHRYRRARPHRYRRARPHPSPSTPARPRALIRSRGFHRPARHRPPGRRPPRPRRRPGVRPGPS
ncbi:MAG: C40 family peptidase, partial [Pseudonocardia sp.]|nr:C40 family peptidase [Pseudonocardia sp.]